MNDYERIARIIRYLDEHHLEQPDLATLGTIAGLSPAHLQRLFSAWAGVSPKDFLQCLTLSHAKELLRNGQSVLQTTLDTGLSSPGRLHDLCISLEAASPGELKLGGQSWTIVAGFAETPFGRCLIGESPRGICHLSFVDGDSSATALATLQAEWPAARLKRDDAAVAVIATQIFGRPASRIDAGGRSADFPIGESGRAFDSRRSGDRRSGLRAFVRGTAFQVRVWRALLQVQPGALVTYGRLADAIGQPTASRAVGSAVGKNPLAYLIPCHRVIRDTGVLGGYRWNPIRKQAIIAWESARQLMAV